MRYCGARQQPYISVRAWEALGEGHPDKDTLDPIPIPIVIVGTKYDLFQDFEPEQRKVICKTLRFVAHMNGASILFASDKDEGMVNTVRAWCPQTYRSIPFFGTAGILPSLVRGPSAAAANPMSLARSSHPPIRPLTRTHIHPCRPHWLACSPISADTLAPPPQLSRCKRMFNALAFNGASSRSVVLDYDKPLIVPAGTDTLSQIGTPSLLNDELRKQGIRNPIDLWQAAYEQYFPPANGGDTQVRAIGRVLCGPIGAELAHILIRAPVQPPPIALTWPCVKPSWEMA